MFRRQYTDYLPDLDSVKDYVPDVPEFSDAEGARALGWASLAIAATELAVPQKVEELLGLDPDRERQGVIRMMGVRELGHGLAILTETEPNKTMARAVASRVIGDVLDTVLLAKAATQTRQPVKFAAVAASVLAIGVADMIMAARLKHHA